MHRGQGQVLQASRHSYTTRAVDATSSSSMGDEDAEAKRSLLPHDGFTTDPADDKLHGRRHRSRFVVSSPVPPFAHRVAELLVLLGLAALAFEAVALPYAYLFPCDTSIDKALLDSNVMDGIEGSAPDWIVRDDRGVPADEREHVSAFHAACTTHSEAIIPFRVGRPFDASQGEENDEDEDQETRDAKTVLYRGDPRTLDELRRCPDVDIYLPGGLRGLGYCEDASAYAKFLESRLLPLWVLEDRFVDLDDPENRTVSYHELCPDTPMLFFNHYWDARPDARDWPANKPIYMMPNIEMHELTAQHFWRSNVVLCKTEGCRDRVSRWYQQEGNPLGSRVLYTKHTSSDVAHHARRALETLSTASTSRGATHAATHSTTGVMNGIAAKDFGEHIRFTHTAGSSVHKGTPQVLQCWLSRPDLPQLDVYIHDGLYDAFYRDAFGSRVADARNINLKRGRLDAVTFGRVVAESAFFLCPSTLEGYGHYINQARAAGGVIVTTDAHPMNELITSSDMGVFVKTKRRVDPETLLGGAYKGEHGLKVSGSDASDGLGADFGWEDLCDAVDFVLQNTTVRERELMSTKTQRAYHEDTKFFARRMLELRVFAREHLPNGGDIDETTQRVDENRHLRRGREA